MAVKLGNGNWAVKEDKLLAYNDNSGRFFNKEFDFARSSSATYVGKDGLIKSAASDVPRIDFSDSTNGALLLEGQRTNLLAYSEQFDNADWVKLGQGIGSVPIVTPNYAISPDGTLNASRLQCDLNGSNTTNDRSWLYQEMSTITGNNTLSLYVKNNSNEDITFSLTNGSSETVLVLSDDKWHRLSTVRSGGGQPRIGLIGGVGASNNADLLIYGAQVEQGSFATSYIPSLSGSATTRLADVCNNSGSAQDFNSEEGVLYFEGSALANDGTNRFISLTDGSNDNRVLFGYRASSNQVFARIEGNNSASVDLTNVVTDTKIVIKLAIYYDNLYNYKMYLNGFLVDSAIGTDSITGLDRLDFTNASGTENFYGSVRDLQVFTTALTDEQLAALTTI